MSTPETSDPVANPTWYGNIRELFNATDVAHMKNMGLDLTSYDEVKGDFSHIYGAIAGQIMPPGSPWPPAMTATFLNWGVNGFPKGTPGPRATETADLATTAAPRLRGDVATLPPNELATLVTAFKEVLAKDVTDPNGYFVQAGYHWFPGPEIYCMHHIPGFNPWHRAYLLNFENALRSIPGCEDVTLPYWDITTPFPEVLKSAPFNSYTFPQDVAPPPSHYVKGYVTKRFAYATIEQNLKQANVTACLSRAAAQTDWEDFHGLFAGANNETLIAAHDSAHNSIGPTMSNPEVAAFDPVFWFFHCNLDRVYWNWQNTMAATDLNGLLSTIDKATDPPSYDIFNIPVLETLPPFTDNPPKLTTVATIDSANSLGVGYLNPPATEDAVMSPKTKRASRASERFAVQTNSVNVRVQNVDRTKIPGSFNVHLLKDGQLIGTRGFFQPHEVEKCATCMDNASVHFDFELPVEAVADGKLEVVVEPLDTSFIGNRLPPQLIGNPTVEVRFLVSNE